MQYRKNKKGEDISILGYGCMRFSTKAGRIDLEKAENARKAAQKQGEDQAEAVATGNNPEKVVQKSTSGDGRKPSK